MGAGETSDRVESECPQAEACFPHLRAEGYRKTSEADPDYNCIAHAAGESHRKWWPTDDDGYYWPLANLEDDSLGAFIAAYGTLGYVPCNGPEVELGYEKVAIYAVGDRPKHAALQLPDTGEWTSKLGQLQDIAHRSLRGVEDGEGRRRLYGVAVCFLKRPVKTLAAPKSAKPPGQDSTA